MRVHKNGSVHVSANAYVPDYRIDAFVIENILLAMSQQTVDK